MSSKELFIPGIYNYCDRWCERCVHTTRCRSYAVEQSLESGLRDSGSQPDDNQAMMDAAQTMLDSIRSGLKDLLRDAGASAQELDALSRENDPHFLDVELQSLVNKAANYATGAAAFLRSQNWLRNDLEVQAVIGRYAFFLGAKVERAARSLMMARIAPDAAWLGDALGSMKAALIAMDRSLDALEDVSTTSSPGSSHSLRLMEQLARLRQGCEAAFPYARDVLRPGLDLPAN